MHDDFLPDPDDDFAPRPKPRPNRALGLLVIVGLLIALGSGGLYFFSRRAPAEIPGPTVPAITAPPARVTAASTRERPTASPTALPIATPPAQPTSLPRLMLDLINADRRANGLPPVQWDETAAQIGEAHAREMSSNDYFSHWDLRGHGPDVRYSLNGGQDASMENISTYRRSSNGNPAPILDLEQVVREAQQGLMKSPGHRANILTPEHTHVGIGVYYDAARGRVNIAQEFVNHYVELDSLPRSAKLGQEITVGGKLLPNVSEPLINIAYEPLPKALSIAEIAQLPGSYGSAAEIVRPMTASVTADRFSTRLVLNHQNKVGLYHIRVWVKVKSQPDLVLAADHVVEVR